MDINNPFETFEKSAFRVEGLPEYKVEGETEAIQYFKENGRVPDGFGKNWRELVNSNIKSGKKMERLRLLSDELTDYERFELQAYWGQGDGENIKIAPRNDYSDLYQYDFWFFDDKWIAQVNYTEDGTFINFDVRIATDDEIREFTYWHAVFEGAKSLRQVSFVSNTIDDLHCLPAAYMSIAKYFNPTFAVGMDEWSELVGFENDKGTWANAGLLWFLNNGYDVKHITLFDYGEFIKHPKEYLFEIDGHEAGQWAYDHSNIPVEVARVKELLEAKIIEKREPTIYDIKRLLDDGNLVRVGLNCNKLDGIIGYIGHAVVVTGYNDRYFTFHDPGLPPIPNRQATFDEFETAWADPSNEAKELDAIRLSVIY